MEMGEEIKRGCRAANRRRLSLVLLILDMHLGSVLDLGLFGFTGLCWQPDENCHYRRALSSLICFAV